MTSATCFDGKPNKYWPMSASIESPAASAVKAEPREDMISDIVHAQLEDGGALTFEEAVSLIRALIIAGNDTTANLIGQMMLFLDRHPDQFEEVKRNPELLTNVIEETLRIHGTSPGLFRTTTCDVEIGGLPGIENTVLPSGRS